MLMNLRNSSSMGKNDIDIREIKLESIAVQKIKIQRTQSGQAVHFNRPLHIIEASVIKNNVRYPLLEKKQNFELIFDVSE